MALRSRHLAVLALVLTFSCTAVSANAACIKLRTIADFEQIRTNLAGSFCLVKDIDASSLANFVPIGLGPYFTGTLDGRGFVIRNLTRMVGHRMSVTGLLLGTGGADGINVNTADSLSADCS